MAGQRRQFPLSPPPPVGSEIDIESFWGTSVGERQELDNDVDLGDGPATMFRVPAPPQLVIQEAAEKLAQSIKQSCGDLEDAIRAQTLMLRKMGIAFLLGVVSAIVALAIL